MSIEELFDILMSDKPSEGLQQNEEELFELIPELEICKGFEQKSKWHIYDVYEHILHVIDNVPQNRVLRLAALFHDVGKPLSYKEDENGVGHFYGHWETSLEIFREFADKHNLDDRTYDMVSHLIYFHDYNLTKLDDESMKKVYELFGKDGINMLYQLKRADLLAQNEDFHYMLDDYEKQRKTILKRFEKLEDIDR